MTLRRNQSVPRSSASVLTTVGLMRVSTGPPARTSDSGTLRVAVGLHDGRGRQHRHRRLAHREDVHVSRKVAEDVDHRVDIVVEIEPPLEQRHAARILPVGDVDLVIGKEGLDRAAQQRREVPRHGGNEQEARVGGGATRIDVALEVDEAAEGMLPRHLLADADGGAIDDRVRDAERRLAVAAGGTLEHLAGGQRIAADGRVRPRVQRVEEHPPRPRGHAGRAQGRAAQLVPVIEHQVCPRSVPAWRCHLDYGAESTGARLCGHTP